MFFHSFLSDSRLISTIRTAAMTQRPTSPHLQIYRLPLTAVLSFAHRVTGTVLAAGLLVLTLFVVALAEGPASFDRVQSVFGGWGGRLCIWLWLFSLFLHLCHGTRHLIWDMGGGFARERLERYARMELVASLLLTAALFLLSPPTP